MVNAGQGYGPPCPAAPTAMVLTSELRAFLGDSGVSGLFASLSVPCRWGRKGTSDHIYPGGCTSARQASSPGLNGPIEAMASMLQ